MGAATTQGKRVVGRLQAPASWRLPLFLAVAQHTPRPPGHRQMLTTTRPQGPRPLDTSHRPLRASMASRDSRDPLDLHPHQTSGLPPSCRLAGALCDNQRPSMKQATPRTSLRTDLPATAPPHASQRKGPPSSPTPRRLLHRASTLWPPFGAVTLAPPRRKRRLDCSAGSLTSSLHAPASTGQRLRRPSAAQNNHALTRPP